MSNIPPPGDHKAKTNGLIQIGEASTGAICITIPCYLPEQENFSTEWLGTIINKDGSINDLTRRAIMEVFGWDGQLESLEALVTADHSDKEFSLGQCTHEEYEGKMRFKPGFLNSANRRIQLKEVSMKDVLAKYGSKFRALSGGKKVETPKTPPKAPAKKTPPPAPSGPTSTLPEVWEAFYQNHASDDQKLVTADWAVMLKEQFPGVDQADITPHQWGALKEKLVDNVPS